MTYLIIYIVGFFIGNYLTYTRVKLHNREAGRIATLLWPLSIIVLAVMVPYGLIKSIGEDG